MNTYLNAPVTNPGGNTGNPQTVIVPRMFLGAILTSKTKKYSQTQMANFQQTLQKDTLASGFDRIYPIFRFKELSDGSQSATKNTSGYGAQEIVRDGKCDWTFTFNSSTGIYNQTQLRQLNSRAYRAFFIDDNGNMFGTQDGNGNFMGAELEFFHTMPFKTNEGTKPTVFSAEFAHANPKDLNENVGVYIPGFNIENTVLGLLNLQLKVLKSVTGITTIGIVTEGDQIDLFPVYGTQLAAATLWSIKNITTGLAVAPTLVAANTTLSGWDVSLPAGTYQIGLVTPDKLALALVGGAPGNGYESIPINATTI